VSFALATGMVFSLTALMSGLLDMVPDIVGSF
jgi:hypothetical protein